ncbi:MAG: chemotaxis protein methyltransferase CheR, partial [Bacteroidota bacterium]|nr:chemotaxis protein methyltransferase CheR [Bacteroidota bacterium]
STLATKISTNHTFFNRENDHFDFFFKYALPEVVGKHKSSRSSDIRVWSAGCSSGEEPYMLVMLMLEYFGKEYPLWDAGVLATDISEKALGIARTAVYAEERVRQLPPNFMKKYFRKKGDEYEVIEDVRKEVTYRKFNLMTDVFPFKKKFDIIFCRNVMIYFDPPTRDALVERFRQSLDTGGFLFIGHSETISRSNNNYEYIMPALYRKV